LRKNAARQMADAVRSALEKVGVLSPRDTVAGGQCSLNTIRKLHDDGPRLMTPDSEWLRKLSAPPQSSNARWDNMTADAGATIGTQRQAAPSAKPSLLGPTHAASIRDGHPLPEDEDVTVKALKEIYRAGPRRGP